VLIIAGSVLDPRVVDYFLVLVLVFVLVLVLVLVPQLKLETLPHSCNSNWRLFSEDHSSVSASLMGTDSHRS
jgi:hypothetical protein